MISCHECSSEVSENDVFCPFCGISLQPIAMPEPAAESPAEPDEAFESTIMMAPDEAARLAAKSTAAPTAPEPQADMFSAGDPVIENAAAEKELPSDVDAVPVPSILTDIVDKEKTNDFVVPKSTSEFQADELQVEASHDATIAAVPVEVTEEPHEDASPEVEGTIIDDESTAEPERSAQIEVPFEAETPVIEASVATEVPTDVAAVPAAQSEPAAEFEPEPEIKMPTDELAAHDPFRSGATFDSVRIMENEIPNLMDEADTKLERPNAVAEPPTPPVAEPPAAVANVDTSGGSFTSSTTGDSDTDGRKSTKLKPLQEGTILNSRYEIIRKIGGGGMGAVYLASDNNLGGVLRAVKEMVQAHIEDEQQEKAINDFKRESMILSSLDHLSIPTIFDYFYDASEGRFYLVMKYISGGDLSSRLRSAPEGKIDEKTVTEWAIQIIDVLDYLHCQPSTIVYRDLKPSNIMVDGNSGRVMLIDFGIARSISQKEEKGVTAVGTMGYAPPELFSGNVEPRSDIYSLGSTMFHLMTGADPQSNPLLIFDFQKNPRPRQINPQLSDQMERILMKAVEYNADSRFTSAAEMRKVLEEHLSNLNAGLVTYGVSEIPASVSLANQNVFCGFCGQRIVATDLFCAFCGSKQPIAQQGVHSGIYSSGSATAKLFVEGTGELSAPTFSLLKDENLVGRRDPMSNIFPEVDLSKYDPQTKISRRHARIWREGSNFLVEDLGSSNGTILSAVSNDSVRLAPHKPHTIVSGDKLRIGDTTLHFVVG